MSEENKMPKYFQLPKQYSEEFKKMVVEEVERGYISKEAAKAKYGIGGNSTVLRWCMKYGKYHQHSYFKVPMKDKDDINSLQISEIEALRLEKLRLEEENRRLTVQNAALEKIIEISNEMCGTDFKKRLGRAVTKLKKDRYRVKECCTASHKSRQAYYGLVNRVLTASASENEFLDIVLRLRQVMPKIGTRKLQHKLKKSYGIEIGRDKLFKLLCRNKLLVKRKRKTPRTTNSAHSFTRYGNKVKDLVLNRAEECFVRYITYIRLKESFFYLHLVSDAYSKRIMGYILSGSLSSDASLHGLRDSLSNRIYTGKLIHHSDRGVQYCSRDFINLLNAHHVTISMTDGSDPRDNAIAERINGILKGELGMDMTFTTIQEASQALERAIGIYNYLRPHLSCGFLTPAEAHNLGKGLRECWKSYPTHRIAPVLVEN